MYILQHYSLTIFIYQNTIIHYTHYIKTNLNLHIDYYFDTLTYNFTCIILKFIISLDYFKITRLCKSNYIHKKTFPLLSLTYILSDKNSNTNY